jgi:hypothetical protein
LLTKFIDNGPYKSAKLNIYLNAKKEILGEGLEGENIMEFREKLRPLLYSSTSNYLLEMTYMMSTEDKLPNRALHKTINLREVINLKAAADASAKGVSLSDSKISYGEITALSRFLSAQVHSEGMFTGSKELDPDANTGF